MLLDRLLGAQIHVSSLDDVADTRKTLGRSRGPRQKVYEIPAGGSSAVGALGYTRCLAELMAQCRDSEHGCRSDRARIRQRGHPVRLGFGQRLFAMPGQILGINVFHPDPRTLKDRVLNLAQTMTERWPDACTDAVFEVNVNHAYFGDGYGLPTRSLHQGHSFGRADGGLALDPVYSGRLWLH